jgi:hypothetical protein
LPIATSRDDWRCSDLGEGKESSPWPTSFRFPVGAFNTFATIHFCLALVALSTGIKQLRFSFISLLRKRSMPLKNSLPEAFSALILVFSNQDGEYLWLPLLLSRALSAV